MRKTKRYCCPAGIWEIENLVGAKVAIRSVGIGAFNGGSSLVDGEYKIKNIHFRISTDGKVITMVELEGHEDEPVTFKDLEVLSVVGTPQESVGDNGLVIGNNTTI